MDERKYLCRECGFADDEESFGLCVVCPECGSRAVVLEDVWKKYGGTTYASAGKVESGER